MPVLADLYKMPMFFPAKISVPAVFYSHTHPVG